MGKKITTKKCNHKNLICDSCGLKFTTAWSNKEADDEAKKLWGIENASEKEPRDVAVVCDDCFNKMMVAYETVN